MNIPSAPAELKIKYCTAVRGILHIIYVILRKLHFIFQKLKTITFKYFFNLFVEKIYIKHIEMLFIDFKKHILLNIKYYCKFFWKYLKNLMFRTKKCVLLTTKRRKNNFCLSNSYFSFYSQI